MEPNDYPGDPHWDAKFEVQMKQTGTESGRIRFTWVETRDEKETKNDD